MQTSFTAAQLASPSTAAAATAIRTCVHCGFCLATCPTYVLRGDELDSPRGRIYLVKRMLERQVAPSPQAVKHIDRCLSCLACETTCPSGVSYRRLIDKGRAYIEEHYRRPIRDRLLRAVLATILPHRGRLRLAMILAALMRPMAQALERRPSLRSYAAMLRLSAAARFSATLRLCSASTLTNQAPTPQSAQLAAQGSPRVLLMRGCVESVLNPAIQAAATRLLVRAGCQVMRAKHEGCCGALVHHMGRERQALQMARANVDIWYRELQSQSLDAIVVTASGCGSLIRDYGYLLRNEPQYADRAARVAQLACDPTELLQRVGLPMSTHERTCVVGYHAPCSLQHGQKSHAAPAQLLAQAGFEVRVPAEQHLCCGSAGVYNLLQPEIAAQLGARKAANLMAIAPEIIATTNIGCMLQISQVCTLPVVHVVQLLDWASGGPPPAAMLAKGALA